MIGLCLGLLTALAYGTSDFIGGLAARRVPALQVVLVSYPVSTVVMVGLALLVGHPSTGAALAWGAASGLAMALATWWLYIALAKGPMSVVSPLTSIAMTVTTVVIGAIVGERMSWMGYLAVAVAIVAVVLVGAQLPTDPDRARSLRPRIALCAVGSGVAFAVAFLCVHQVPSGTGLWPMVASRGVAMTVVIAMAVATKRVQRVGWGSPVLLPAVAVALLDVGANVAVLYAFEDGLLTVVSVVVSLHPAVTVLLALVLLRENLRRRQLVGLGLAMASIAAISATSP